MPFFVKYRGLLTIHFFVFLFRVLRPTQFFTYMESSPLPITSLRFSLLLGTQAMEQWGFFSVSHLLWNRASPRTRDTHICCRAIGSGIVTTCFNDLGLSQLGFEHPTFRMRGKRSNRLRHHDSPFVKESTSTKYLA